jgi:hypothetical protein
MDPDEGTATATDAREPRARIGIVGTGAIFPIYARGLAWYGDLPIVRVADVAVERAREQAAAHGIPAAGTVEDVLADPEVDVVVNITPPTAHFPVTRDALAAGKHVYVEKPPPPHPSSRARTSSRPRRRAACSARRRTPSSAPPGRRRARRSTAA